MISPLVQGVPPLLTIIIGKLVFRFPRIAIAIVTVYHNLRKILESIRAKLDNAKRERTLSIDKGQHHKRSRPMTILLLFAVAIIVAALAQTTLSPRIP